MPIKAFKENERPAQKSNKTLLVSDIMRRDLVLFTKDQSIHEVMKKFIKYRYPGAL